MKNEILEKNANFYYIFNFNYKICLFKGKKNSLTGYCFYFIQNRTWSILKIFEINEPPFIDESEGFLFDSVFLNDEITASGTSPEFTTKVTDIIQTVADKKGIIFTEINEILIKNYFFIIKSATLAALCGDDSWKCGEGNRCVLKSKLCDGVFDCSDQSDERNCTTPGILNRFLIVCNSKIINLHFLNKHQ